MNPDSLGSRIKKRNTFVASFDEEQFNTIVGYDNENLRIRGLAGSGKTIILLKKMAYLHYKDRSKNLAIVFYTMSLKQYVLRLFKKFYSDYDKFNQPDMSKIQVLHGWGGKARAGFYSVVCERNDITPKTYGHYKKDKHPLESACSDLLAKLGYRNIDLFDYVLIDEAQDFGINFFRLARKSLTQNGKLIYAYDELQSLNDESIMPSKGEIFESESCRDINLRTSYRAPVEILVTAHAIGLGIYREAQSDGHSVVNIIEDIETWTAIGYEATKGELKEGKYVELERNENLLDNSSQIVNFEKFKSETKQYEKVSNLIIDLIKNEDILPEDILIIDMDSSFLSQDFMKFKQAFYDHASSENLLDENFKSEIDINLVSKDDPISFRKPNSIPFTTIYRAKGNEANIVIVLNAGRMTSAKSVTRNSLFTATTRARFSVYIMGDENIQTYIDEYERTREENYKLCFTYPTGEEMQEIRMIAKKENTTVQKYASISKSIEDIKKDNEGLALDLLIKSGKSLSKEQLRQLIAELGADDD